MILGATNGVGSDYNIGTAGQQFANACAFIKGFGLRAFKAYCTPDYESDNYTLQTWPGGISSLTTLAQSTPFATQFADSWWSHVVLTVYTFANTSGAWWISNLTQAKLLADYVEMKAFVSHLLTTYSGSGKTFVLQRWENDWTLMNGTSNAAVYVPRDYIDRYAAFLGNCQRAVEDARRETAHYGVTVVNALEANRILDRDQGRHRVVNEIAQRVQPDWVSWSAYDGTIDNSPTFTWGSSLAVWAAYWEPRFRDGMRALRTAFPGKPIYLGEVGFPENEVPVSWGSNGVGDVIQYVHDWAVDEGVELFLYWNTFANDLDPTPPPTYRGLWLVDDLGNVTVAGAKMQELAA